MRGSGARWGWLLWLVACAGGDDPPEAPPRSLFIDRAAELGVDFRHETGASGRLYMPETTGGGVGLFDYDGDGDLDLYLVQSGTLDGAAGDSDRLFRNDLAEGEAWRFVDVTAESGLAALGYGQGIAIGDVDNDGWLDLFLANLGADELWINRGDGRFELQTSQWGLGDDGWATSAVFFDFDEDGWQDLFVTRYLVWSPASHKDCRFQTGMLDYCKPASYSPTVDLLYRNAGGLGFEPVDSAEMSSLRTNGLGIVAADLNEDGWLDLYVANDQLPNLLWLNDGSGGFVEDALLAGVAVNREGMAEASMGLVAEDLDRDGILDLFSTHLDGETNTFYRGRGAGLFDDDTRAVGLAGPSLNRTAFGVGALDYDNDGWLDLALTTGGVHVDPDQVASGEPLPLRQIDQFYRSQEGRFLEMSEAIGPDFLEPSVGRGLAVGDLDNDGDADLVVNNAQGSPRLLINQSGQDAGWLGVVLLGAPGRHVPEAAPVRLAAADGTRWLRWARRGASYLSSHDNRVLFGLGEASGPYAAQVDGPGKERLRLSGLPAGAYVVFQLQKESS